MARSMSEKYSEAYRAAVKVTTTHEDQHQSERVSYYGPFATAAAAKGQITRETREIERQERHRDTYRAIFGGYSESATGWIEKSSAKWERVD